MATTRPLSTVTWCGLLFAPKTKRSETESSMLKPSSTSSGTPILAGRFRRFVDAFWNTPRLPLLHSGENELRAAIFVAVNAGDLALTDGSGNPYTAHSETEINLQSNSIRLVKAGEQTNVLVPNVTGMTVETTTTTIEAVGLVASVAGTGTVTAQTPPAGVQIEPGSTVTATAVSGGHTDGGVSRPTEFQVKVTTISSIDDTAKRDAVRLLVTQIANAIDTSASHVRLTAEVTVTAASKETLTEAANNAGASVSITKL